MGTTLNLVHTSLKANCPNVPYNQPPPSLFLWVHGLVFERFSLGSTRAISKNKEPPEVITVISTRDQLVTRSEKVYGELFTNKPKKLIKC